MEHNNFVSQAEAFLFAEGGVLSLRKLAQLLDATQEETKAALDQLSEQLNGRGLVLIQTDAEVTLAVAPSVSPAVLKSYEKELGREVGDAGLEVIAIILYRGASTRAQIDYIRGVNTTSTIRTLLSRGLIERISNPLDSREYLYQPSTELLAHLGVEKVANLPEYVKIRSELAAYEKTEELFKHNGSRDDSDAGSAPTSA